MDPKAESNASAITTSTISTTDKSHREPIQTQVPQKIHNQEQQDKGDDHDHDKVVEKSHRQNNKNTNHGGPCEHHANELKPVAQNIVMQESIVENQRKRDIHKSIERYKMGPTLGEGAFSVVYSATDMMTNEKVAIKIIKKYQLDEKQRNNVLKEVNIMKLLNHPNIVKLIDFIENDDYYYLIQEVVSGGEIFNQIVKFTYFSEDLSRHVIIQVAEALLYMHEHVGIVHRDLKPENIFFKPIKMVKEDHKTRFAKLRKSDNPNSKLDEGKFIMNYGGGGIGLIKIGDFGLSKQINLQNSGDPSLKTPCGTVGYTAPEIVRDMKYSKQVDMWALGCVLYILLCGFPPFFNDSIEELTKTVARGEFKFLSPWWDEISSGAKHCVSKLLTVNPLHRYTVEEFLRDPWILDFLNRSENIQMHENLKKKQRQQFQSQAQSHAKLPENSGSSDTSKSDLTNTTLNSNITNTNTNTSASILEALIKKDISAPGMPGLEPPVIPGTTGTKFPSVYSQSVVDLHNSYKMDVDDDRNQSEYPNEAVRRVDDNYYDGEGIEVLGPDADISMSDQTGMDTDDSVAEVILPTFGDGQDPAVAVAVPMLEHILEPAPVQESLRSMDDEGDRNNNNSSSTKRSSRHESNNNSGTNSRADRSKRKLKSKSKSKNPLFTPEVKAMRDMFDISLAAHRIHEEAQYTPGFNTVVGFNELNIVEEVEDSDGVVQDGTRQDVPATAVKRQMFKLNMNDATILARRQKKRKAIVV